MIIKNYYRLGLLLIGMTSIVYPANNAPSLATFNHSSAAVLPTFTKNGEKWVVVASEASKRKKGQYDSFGGKKDHNETPLQTAARECAEEIISHITMNKNVSSITRYINPKHKHTEHVLVIDKKRTKYVMYITQFDRYIESIKNNFYHALTQVYDWKYKEKDHIAFIQWDTLKTAIINNPDNKTVTVQAKVIHPKTLKLETKIITLRPILAKSLRPFFENKPYTKGKNPKVRFYH